VCESVIIVVVELSDGHRKDGVAVRLVRLALSPEVRPAAAYALLGGVILPRSC
jgi:hypothetical protein